MEFFDLTILIFTFIYTCLILFICFGLFRLPKSKGKLVENYPTVAVIVSAKNEERDIVGCIQSLENLTYPKDALEVILVDDASTDKTTQLIKEAAARNEHFTALSTLDAPKTHLRAKARGVAWGMKNTDAEWVFITDADGSVQPSWIEHMLTGVDDSIGMIGGMVAVKDRSLLAIFERMSWAFTLPFAFGMAGYGGEFICVGPNMALRKKIYDEYGGLEASEFNVAEDLALFRMVEESEYGVKSHVSKETKVDLEPVPSLKHLLSQQRRWLKGGFEGSWKYWIGLVLAFGFHNVLSILFVTGLFISVKVTLAALLIKAGVDLLLLISEKILLKEERLLRYFPIMEINVIVTLLWLPISLLINSTIHWMGDDYVITYTDKSETD